MESAAKNVYVSKRQMEKYVEQREKIKAQKSQSNQLQSKKFQEDEEMKEEVKEEVKEELKEQAQPIKLKA